MYDCAGVSEQSKIVSELFEQTGKGWPKWTMNDKKPFFQQALT
jgi:hypothetical protein